HPFLNVGLKNAVEICHGLCPWDKGLPSICLMAGPAFFKWRHDQHRRSRFANRHSEWQFSPLQFFGDTLHCPVGHCLRSLRRGLVEDSLSLVVHAQKRIAVDSAYVPVLERKNLIAHVLATSSR